MRRLFQSLIRLYQKTLSPDHGWFSWSRKFPRCKYYPTCSQYAHDAIGKYGVIRGGVKSIWRMMRCNPWSKGGVDLP
ncbi:MAG: membrane protein insertion efficiency factor YidD [Patescibacteria group bacterium]